MKRIIGLIAVAFGLSGCASDELNNGLGFSPAQNIEFVVSRLGHPDSKRELLGDTIYIWSTSQNVDLLTTTTSTTMGIAGTPPGYGTSMGMAFVPANFDCTMQLAVGTDGTIKSWKWSGDLGACAGYAQALSR
jgi:hypothetical protein